MHVTYIIEVKEAWSHRFLGQMHAQVFMRSRCRCTRLLTFWWIIRSIIKCACFFFKWSCKRDVSSFVLIHIRPARLFGSANVKEKDRISGESGQRGSDDVMAKRWVTKDVRLVSENRTKLGWLVSNQFIMAASCSYLPHQGLINLIQSVHIWWV